MSQIKVCSSALAAHRGNVAGNKFNILREQISRLSDSVRRRKKKETATTLHCDQKNNKNTLFHKRTQMVIWTFVRKTDYNDSARYRPVV